MGGLKGMQMSLRSSKSLMKQSSNLAAAAGAENEGGRPVSSLARSRRRQAPTQGVAPKHWAAKVACWAGTVRLCSSVVLLVVEVLTRQRYNRQMAR